jgi:hypothetical protein
MAMVMKEHNRLPPVPGRMPERSSAISGDETSGLTKVSAAQPESVKAAKLRKIAETARATTISK